MIVKSMSRKAPSFGQLLKYMRDSKSLGPAICHNLSAGAHDLAAIEKEFLGNYNFLPPRKNGNVLYHEVLSFSDFDRPNVTPKIIEDLTRKYLDLRAPFALAFAQAHLGENECAHVHIMISANNRGSYRRVSLSRAEFGKIKRQLEEYQKSRYPFLEHSIVFDRSDRKEGIRKTRQERERDRRLKKEGKNEPSRKEQLHDLVAEQIARVSSAKALRLRLKLLGLQLYRRGDQYGILDSLAEDDSAVAGRKYRLSTLGLDETHRKATRQWKELPERLVAMEEQDIERADRLWLAQTQRQRIQDVVGLHVSELSELERHRLEQIQAFRASQKEKGQEPPELSR